jgi:hypothetical protein
LPRFTTASRAVAGGFTRAADVVGMSIDHHDEDPSGACAACDLTARLQSELTRSRACLSAARQELAAARDAQREPPPRALRRQAALVGNRRRQVADLERVLAELVDCHGDYHAASA